jgi:hypothetical protein
VHIVNENIDEIIKKAASNLEKRYEKKGTFSDNELSDSNSS